MQKRLPLLRCLIRLTSHNMSQNLVATVQDFFWDSFVFESSRFLHEIFRYNRLCDMWIPSPEGPSRLQVVHRSPVARCSRSQLGRIVFLTWRQRDSRCHKLSSRCCGSTNSCLSNHKPEHFNNNNNNNNNNNVNHNNHHDCC